MQRCLWVGSKVPGNLGQTSPYQLVQSVYLGQNHRRVLAVVGQTLHHRAEQGLRKTGRYVKSFLHRELASRFRSLDNVPAFLKKVNTHDYRLRGFDSGGGI